MAFFARGDKSEENILWENTWFTRWVGHDTANPIIVRPNEPTTINTVRYKQGLNNLVNFYTEATDVSNWVSFLTDKINVRISGWLTFEFDVSGIRQIRVRHRTIGTEILDYEIFNTSLLTIETRNAVAQINQITTVNFFREKFAFDVANWDKELFQEFIFLEAFHSAPVPLKIIGGQLTLAVEGESS